jgi:hypothetical protein
MRLFSDSVDALPDNAGLPTPDQVRPRRLPGWCADALTRTRGAQVTQIHEMIEGQLMESDLRAKERNGGTIAACMLFVAPCAPLGLSGRFGSGRTCAGASVGVPVGSQR